MSETNLSDEQSKVRKEEEEREWRTKVLEEMHLMRRALEKIAERVGGMTVS